MCDYVDDFMGYVKDYCFESRGFMYFLCLSVVCLRGAATRKLGFLP